MLAIAHAEVLQAVRAVPVKNVDETSWKKGRKMCWLWVAATSHLSVFLIHGKRGLEGLWQLLGTVPTGILCSDRWSAYNLLALDHRQVCWAHLKRDFKKWADRPGAGKRVGQAGLEVVRELFVAWHRYRDGPGDRQRLQAELAPVRQRLEEALRMGQRSRLRSLQSFCDNLLALGPALWTFARVDGVEPTNNHAERVLRRGVLWRKCSQGSRSDEGCRFVERMLTAVQSLRLQRRSVLNLLTRAVTCAPRKHFVTFVDTGKVNGYNRNSYSSLQKNSSANLPRAVQVRLLTLRQETPIASLQLNRRRFELLRLA